MSRPHALVLPFPLQGHISPLMQLAQHLAFHGFLVTFVNTQHNHARILQARGKPVEAQESSSASFSLCPGFNMVGLPDGLPLQEQRTYKNVGASLRLHMPPLLEQLVSEINQTSTPITCVIADTFMGWVLQIVERARIPAAFAFFVSGMAQLSILCHVPLLISSGQVTPDGLPKDFDKKIIGLPGLHDMPSRDLPWLLGDLDESKYYFSIAKTMYTNAKKFDAILVNSYYELENEAMDVLLQEGIKIKPVGPVVLLKGIDDHHYNLPSSNLLAEDKGCLEWLEGKTKHSVLYIAFGSIAQFSYKELHELALGIEASQQTFLWVLRQVLMHGGQIACLPLGFIERTKDRAYFTSWAPQTLVLSHPSIGAFLTHCGWNSTMEAISMGVPMLTWPYFADHKGVSHQIVQEWKIGLPLLKSNNQMSSQQEVEKLVRSILNGKEGTNMRQRLEEFKHKAKLAISKNFGLSFSNLQDIIQLSSSKA